MIFVYDFVLKFLRHLSASLVKKNILFVNNKYYYYLMTIRFRESFTPN